MGTCERPKNSHETNLMRRIVLVFFGRPDQAGSVRISDLVGGSGARSVPSARPLFAAQVTLFSAEDTLVAYCDQVWL